MYPTKHFLMKLDCTLTTEEITVPNEAILFNLDHIGFVASHLQALYGTKLFYNLHHRQNFKRQYIPLIIEERKCCIVKPRVSILHRTKKCKASLISFKILQWGMSTSGTFNDYKWSTRLQLALINPLNKQQHKRTSSCKIKNQIGRSSNI